MQEPKYRFKNGRVIKRASGEAIPEDEPVMVFRARDVWARHAIAYYAQLVRDEHHRDVVLARVNDFGRFANEFPERMKEPDTEKSEAPHD